MSTSILGVIQHYQRSIEKCQTDEARLLHCISKLYKLPVKVEHLQETGIGKTVNSLRKFDGEIGTAAKTLVAKWKAMVAAEEEPMETSCHQDDENKANGEDNDTDEDDDGDHKNHNKKIESNSNNDKLHSESNTHSSSKDKGYRGKHRSENESGNKNSSSLKSHHTTSASSSHLETDRNKCGNKSNYLSSNKDKNNIIDKNKKIEKSDNKQEKSDKSGKSDHKPEKSDHKLEKSDHKPEKTDQKPEKPKSVHHGSGDKDQNKQKHTSSSRHKKSNKEDSEHSKESHNYHSRREKKRHNEEKGSSQTQTGVRQESSSSKEKDRSSQKRDSHKQENHKTSSREDRVEKQEKHKSSSKHEDPDLDNERKKHSSSNKNTSSSSTNAAKDKPSTSTEDSSERKRKHDSDQDSTRTKSSKEKPSKRNKVAEENIGDEDDDKGIDSSMGANFADVLGMLNTPNKKFKKNSNMTKSPTTSGCNKISSLSKDSSSSTSSKINGIKPTTSTISLQKLSTKPDLLSSSAKLEPLDPSIVMELPTISTNYKPLPLSQNVLDVVFPSSSTSSNAVKQPVRTLTDAEAISHGISSKTMRTKIYSGVKTGQLLQVPTLFDLCIRILQKNIDALEYTGGVPFEVLRPVLERASPQQLLVFEEYNPYLMEDCDVLWQQHVQRHYRSHKRQEYESWREMFLRCQEDQERRLNNLAESIKQSQKIIAAPVRKTQLAYVDSAVKPPRNVQRKQEQFGTKSKLVATPAARVAALSNVTPNVAKTGDARLRVAASVRDNAQVASIVRPLKKAPLMAKTLQFMRGRHKR